MVNYNILYDTGTGRIQTANLATITPIPVGFAVLVKDVPEASNLWNKRIEISNLKLVNKNTLELESDPTVSIATVNTMAFTKRDGETQELKGDVSDADWSVYSRAVEIWEQPELCESVVEVETDGPVNGALEKTLSLLACLDLVPVQS